MAHERYVSECNQIKDTAIVEKEQHGWQTKKLEIIEKHNVQLKKQNNQRNLVLLTDQIKHDQERQYI